MRVVEKLFSIKKYSITLQRYYASNVLKLSERGLLQDVFPPPK